ncbi:branched-chain amino acid ABC transporter permease [Azospirillum halopraeferens]|uniref:branched-chain amino acid ABC transporter permease n=1 Tax=Azospirillum halopraeferens TaxID=34010 RepID=UPI00041EA2B5|nr:branched-chain amino acid ABC transporter permease [Azospirillum halopraeferens]
MTFDWLLLAEVSLAGLGTGGLYALTALAFVIIYKATRVVNLAIGEILMLGAYAFFGFTATLALPWWAAALGALAVAGVFGAVTERLVIRPMLGESPIAVFMVTVGLGSILVGLVEILWTADPRRLPEFMPATPVFIGEAFLAPKIAYGFLVAAAVITVFMVLFRTWRGGVALRATAGDRAAAYSVGINVPGVFSLAWVIACVVAAGAGILVGAIGGISSTMGVFGLSVLVVVIVGGLDSVPGALVGGLLIGLIEALAGFYLGGEYKLLATFSLLVAVLMVRPYGLFGTREIERL